MSVEFDNIALLIDANATSASSIKQVLPLKRALVALAISPLLLSQVAQ